MCWRSQNSETSAPLHAVWCNDREAIAVGGHGSVLSRCHGRWVRQAVGTEENLHAVFGSDDGVVVAGGDLHVGGNSLIVSRDPTGWQAEPSGIQHILLAVSRAEFGWVLAGYNAGVVLGRPGSWTEGNVGHAMHVFGLCAAAGRAVACGLSGSVTVYDGNRWQMLQTGVEMHLRAICAPTPRTLMAVGLGGTILRWDGERWESMASPTQNSLEGIWGGRADEVYAVGYAGTILRFDGRAWRLMDAGTRVNLYGVYGTRDEVIAVGAQGTVLSHRRQG